MDEQYYDALLNIKTAATNGFSNSMHYHRYEPTPYLVLELLRQQYVLNITDRIVDFGCGKGRFMFYMNNAFGVGAAGIEMDEKLIKQAGENQVNYTKKRPAAKNKIVLVNTLAEDYKIHPLDNKFYFFNPFTVQVFMKVVNNILRSIEDHPRVADIILYYPANDYIYYLENQTAFELEKEILIDGLYDKNKNERILIWRLNPFY